MAYHITLNRKVIKQLEKIPVSDYEAIKKSIYGLVNDPKPYGSIKLLGLQVSKASIAKITGVDRATLVHFIKTRNI